MDVLIAGAGLGGLAAALSLHAAGCGGALRGLSGLPSNRSYAEYTNEWTRLKPGLNGRCRYPVLGIYVDVALG